jgi:hypothetical protein
MLSLSSSQTIKAQLIQGAFVGGGGRFDLWIPCSEDHTGRSYLSGIVSSGKHYLRPEAYYRPAFLDSMPVGFDRYDAFLSFEKELAIFLAPFVHKAFPLSRQFGDNWNKSIIPYDQKIKGKKATVVLPAWEAQ